ncbi:MAG: argininosuccinate lyase [Chthonomonadales bacterium]|nr:argininosuccinate lyase [Chthonomonadales bacterium]
MAPEGPGGGPRLWGGRFDGGTDAAVARLNNSLPFDRRLWREDLAGSVAHATMLGEAGILPAPEAEAIVEALREIEADLASGAVDLDPDAEDVHTAVEALLRQRIGPLAGKLHTARSRNDQVVTDARLFARSAVDTIAEEIVALQGVLLELAEREAATTMPGYTHMQHAQPILLAHHLLAYFWMLQRDRERLADARKRIDLLPLGAGALAGSPYPVDRERVAEILGFGGILENSLDAVSDRDFAIETLADAAILAMHLSRFAEDLVLWNTLEFGFVELDDSVTTGSSMMPQKKNPDVAELARGKSGRVFGNLMALLTVMKGLPLSYNKDMQEDKEPLFDTVDTLLVVLPAFRRMLETASFGRERMARALRGDFSTATDLADSLVRGGMAFRDAHGAVGRLVRHCVETGTALDEMDAQAMARAAPELARVDAGAATVAASVAARRVRGGTAPDAVREQLARARAALGAVV